MKPILYATLFLAVFLFFAVPVFGFADFQKGASIRPADSNDFSSSTFQASLDQLRATNANYVNLILPYYQSNKWSTDIQRGWNTPTDDSLIDAITYAHSIGLKVSLNPHLSSYDGGWRAYINPSDREGWFEAYGDMLRHYAALGQQYGVEQIVMGTELIHMSSEEINQSNTQNWIKVIQSIRPIYGGQLTYSANWGPSGFVDEKRQVKFWGHLDSIGISAYFALWKDDSRPIESLKQAWADWDNSHIQPLHQQYQKPIVFPEIGCASRDNCHEAPWRWENTWAYEQDQADFYEATFSYWSERPYFTGLHMWDWHSNPDAGGPGNNEFTPQNKQAQEVMRQWYGSMQGTPADGGETPPSPPPASEPPMMAVSASLEPSQSQEEEQVSFQVEIQVQEGSLSNGVVDLEAYNSQGSQMFQRFFEGESISVGSSKVYTATWTPSSPEEYRLAVGVFGQNWSPVYQWEDNAVSFTPGSPSGETPPPPASEPGTIDLWWPTDGSTVSGVQPIKAMLQNWSVDEYVMYWQVDGGGLVEMPTNLTDYPHKEAEIDYGPWTWDPNNQYAMKVIVQDLSGSFLAEKAFSITVAH